MAIFFKRYIIIFLLILFGIGIVVYYVSEHKLKEHYINLLTNDLKHLSQVMIPDILSLLERQDKRDLDKFIKNIGNNIDVRITVIDYDGVVIADSKFDPLLMENYRDRPEVLSALEGKEDTVLRYSSTLGQSMLYAAVPFYKDGKIIGVVRVSMFLRDIDKLINELGKNLLWSFIVFSLAIIILFILLSMKLSRDLNKLTDLSKRLAEGDFSVKMSGKQSKEFKELWDNFNYMAEKIRDLFDEISKQKEQLFKIINSVKEFLIVIDAEGRIVLCNRSFKEFVGEQNLESKYYWEVVREVDFNGLLKRVENGSYKEKIEIEIRDRIYACSIAKLRYGAEAIFILSDITDIYSLNKIKKDLVENVSHELKTPLTAIKGFVETLEQEVDSGQQNYIKIIKRHTDRLIKIVNDLLVLSSIEGKSSEVSFERVNLEEIIKEVKLIFQDKILFKGLDFNYNIERDLPEILGDAVQIENMFINLIENAINYTEKGGIEIDVRSEEPYIRIEVKDTGIGIPGESLDRIFERFYVVDKSRSRKAGGSGLGLSIVKHIVLMHNGTIQVKSELNKGTSFIIKLPKAQKIL